MYARLASASINQSVFQNPKAYQELPDPKPCNDEAPEAPNVYADGSLKKPRRLRWAIGGVGVWGPKRTTPPTEDELNFAQVASASEGTMLWNTNYVMEYFQQLKK